MLRNLLRLITVCLLFFIAVPGLFAQVSTADIVGTVTDQAGAVVADASVTVENVDTREKRATATGGSGDFVFNLLQPGRYTVSVQSKGSRWAPPV